ncbi:MAG: tripartite tricarboxylate transporter substrate binding protein [Rubrivivax sp.]
MMARAFAQRLGERRGQAVYIENVPGGSGAIAARAVLRSPPDGHTLLVGVTSDLITTPLSSATAGYDHRSFAAIAKLGGTPLALATSPATGWTSVDQVIEAARKAPLRHSVGLSGSTALSAFAVAQFVAASRAEFLQIPYQGAAPAMVALLSHQVDLAFMPLSVAYPHARSGRVVVLGLLADARTPLLPDVPTLGESKLARGVNVEIWAALLGPRGTPGEVVQSLNDDVREILVDRAFVDQRTQLGESPARPMSVAETASFIDAEADRYAVMIQGLARSGR